MKRILIASALALATATPAFAADLPPAAPPPPRAPVAYVPAPPPFSWTGFYIGLNTGYAFGQSNWNSPIGTTGNFDVSGAMAGVTLGGNYQIGQFVVGGETDIDWQNVRGSQVGGNCNLGPGAPASCASASNWVGTFRARAGFAMDHVLVYATAGGAYANIKASLDALPWASSTELGWTAGAGVEAVPPASVSFDESMVRVGVNYKFGY